MGSYMEILPASNPLSATERRTHDGFMSTFQDTAVKPVVHPDPLPFQYKAARNGCIPKSGPIKNTPFTRTPAFPIEKLKASLPKADVDPAVDHATIVSSCLKDLCDFESEIFTEEAVWRDLYALTGTLRTFHGSKHIRSCWGELSDLHHQSGFSLMAGTSMVVRLDVDCSWIQARYSFKTAGQPELICSGQIGIVPDGKSGWRIWLLTTILEEIKGLPNPDFMEPHTKRQTTDRTTTAPDLYQFDCVVVGAGFAGLCLAGRLKAMGVHSVTLERNANVGDNWTKRYESARCKVFNHLTTTRNTDVLCSSHIQRLQYQLCSPSFLQMSNQMMQVTCRLDEYSQRNIHISSVARILLRATKNMPTSTNS